MLSLVCKMAGAHTMKHFNRRCRRNLFVLLLIAVVIGLESSYLMLDILTDDLVFWIKIYIFYFMKISEYVKHQHQQSVIINVAASGNRRTIFLCETNYSGFSAFQFYQYSYAINSKNLPGIFQRKIP